MELIEKQLRNTPSGHKKYLKRLSDYVKYLSENGRILEAKYFFSEINKLKPNHIKTIILGYELAIKTFDNESVIFFDRALYDTEVDKEILLVMRVKYYYSVNDEKEFTQLIEHLLFGFKVKKITLELIVELVINQNSYKPISILLRYLKDKSLLLNKQTEGAVRWIVLQKLVDTLAEAAK